MKFTKWFGISVVIGLLIGIMSAASYADGVTAEMNAELKAIEEKVYYTPRTVEVVVVEPEVTEVEPVVEVIEPVKKAPYKDVDLAPEYQIYLEQRCEDKDINFYLALALMKSESNFKTDAEGDNGRSIGLMQINSCWWEVMEDAGIDVFNPLGNIEAGLLILDDYLNRGYSEVEAIQLYKCGEYRGRELLKDGVIIESAKKVVEAAKEMEGNLE